MKTEFANSDDVKAYIDKRNLVNYREAEDLVASCFIVH